MTESNTPIAIFGIITILVIAIVTIAALLLLNIIQIPGIDSPYHIQNGTIVERADLRVIALPYLAGTNIKEDCIAANGTWHETSTFVGCEGYGPDDCTTPITISGMTQCIGVGANWSCGTAGIYCKY